MNIVEPQAVQISQASSIGLEIYCALAILKKRGNRIVALSVSSESEVISRELPSPAIVRSTRLGVGPIFIRTPK